MSDKRVIKMFSTYFEKSGAGIGSDILRNAFLSSNMKVVSYIHRYFDGEYEVYSLYGNQVARLLTIIDTLYNKFLFNKDLAISVGLKNPLVNVGKIVKEDDIVLLQWINQGFLNIDNLVELKNKDIMFTVRDYWIITGGCHYPPDDCNGYTKGCRECPLVPKSRRDAVARQFQKKLKLVESNNVSLIGISSYSVDILRSSPIGRLCHVDLIHNIIDLESYSPIIDCEMRDGPFSGNKENRKIAVFCAIDAINDHRKGFKLFRESIIELNNRGVDIVGYVIGNKEEMANEKHFVYFGSNLKSSEINKIYNVADLAILPSKNETFGKTVAESISAGTPVVIVKGSGAEDIVIPDFNGVVIQDHSIDAVCNGVTRILGLEFDKSALHSDIKLRFSNEEAVKLYIDQIKMMRKQKDD